MKKFENNYPKSSGKSPLSSRMFLKIFGWRIFAPWEGTVARFPSMFLKILWPPLWRAKVKPFFSNTEIACAAVTRGNLGTVLSGERNLNRRKNGVFRFFYFFFFGKPVLDMELDSIMDVGKRFFIGVALAVTALERGARHKIARFVFFEDNREMIGMSRFHTASIANTVFLSIFLFASLLLPSVTYASAIIAQPDNTGLVGYWSFDASTINGTTVKDMSGKGNNGTLVGSPTSVPGVINQALEFDGSTSYVNASSFAATLSSATLTAWIKLNSFTSWHGIIFSRGPATGLSLGNTNTLAYTWNNAANTYNFVGPLLTTGQWEFVAVSVSPTQATLYASLKGVLNSATNIYSHSPTTIPSGSLRIGDDNCCSNRFLNGSIDEVRIYNRALTAAQVATLYNDSKAAHVADTNKTTLSSGLVGYWPLDGDTINWKANTTADMSGNNNTGTLVGMSTTTSPVAGKIGGALGFNGTSSYISVNSSSSLTPGTSNFSLSLWVYPSQSHEDLINNSNNNGASFTAGYALILRSGCIFGSGGNVQFDMANGTSHDTGICSASSIPLNNWSHITVVVSRLNTISIYINGRFDKSIATSLTGSVTPGTFSIGKGIWTAYLSGKLDDVRIYNRALSANEVKQLYALGSANIAHSNTVTLSTGLVGYWPLDGEDINWKTYQVQERSGNNVTTFIASYGGLSALSTTTAPVAGKIGQALNLRGGVSSGDALGFLASSVHLSTAATFAAWIKMSAYPSARMGIIADRQGSTGVGFDLSGSGDLCGQGKLEIWEGNSGNTCGIATLALNTWYHVTAVLNGTARTIYVNGVLDSNTSGAWTWPGGTAFIGSGNNSANYFFSGSLDDVRIYNRALSANEVKQLYLTGK
jgi:hypothetical protein